MQQWIIKLADDELKLVTSDELLQMEKTAEEFDGFYGWQVLGKLNKHDVSNSVCVCGKIIDNIDREHGMCHKCWGIVGD